MKISLYLIALTLIFGSCQNTSNEKKDSQLKTDTVATSNPIGPVTKDKKLYSESFDEFWKSFRQAVSTSDTSLLVALTQFPFETRGPLDSDPTIRHNKQKFPNVFQAFLNQWNGMDLEGTTELESIKKTITINKKNISDEYTRVGDLVFKKTKDGWKLVFAYLNNETIDELGK